MGQTQVFIEVSFIQRVLYSLYKVWVAVMPVIRGISIL